MGGEQEENGHVNVLEFCPSALCEEEGSLP